MPILRSAFIALSHNRPLRHFCEHSRLGSRLNSRFIAGMAPDDALRVAEEVNRQGIAVTLDSLGESVTSESAAHLAADVYHKLLDSIGARGIQANISVKLTQMGLEQSADLAESIAGNLVEHARATGNFVRIDMEDSRLTASYARHRAPHPCTPCYARRCRRRNSGLLLSFPGRRGAVAR